MQREREKEAFVAPSCRTSVCVYARVCPYLITIKPGAWMQPKSLTRAPANFMKTSVQMENNCPAEGRPSKFMLC